MNCVHCLLTRETRIQWINTCTLIPGATASTRGGGEETGKTQFPFSVASAVQNGNTTWIDVGSFPLFPPSPTDKIIISPLADMLSWALWFKFLLNKLIASTCLFIVTSFSKQSTSRNVLEICEMCALSTDSPKTYSVNKYMYTGSNSYSFDWGGGVEETEKTQFPFSVASAFQNGNTTWKDVWSFPCMYTRSSSHSFDCGLRGGEGTEKTQFPFSVASAFENGNTTWKDVGSFPLFPPGPNEKILISPLADMLSWAVWFKFLPNEVIAITCLFILTSFSKQSASW